MTMRLRVPFILCGFFLLFSSSWCFPSSIDDLDAEIKVLSATATKTEADVDAAFLRLKSETNLDRGPLLVGGVASTFAGDIIEWPISFVASSEPVSGLQADIALPSGFSIVSISAGPVTTQAGKSVSSNGDRFIVAGLNQTAIKSGVVAIVRIQIASTAFVGLNSICLGAPVASDPSGQAVLISATSGTVDVAP